MAYDRYLAICNPLRYMLIMNKTMCIWLAAASWSISFMNALPHTVLMSRLSYCGSHTINHFFCDITALMKLSCSRTHVIETITYIVGALVGVIPFLLIITSYIMIISTVLKIRSSDGRYKAFSTCGSHITVVILFYGMICSTYMRPTSMYSIDANKLSSLLYIAVSPLCNPIIYSLKNEDFKRILRKATNRV
ncbi:olfactory receptor 5V1-like [Ambystoma mexicanum]|uniref:olfactory receptor 5V1-like n=1 Tax=Ambystoma mexicanum TaxID=8296 RepID=UPI0037E99767